MTVRIRNILVAVFLAGFVGLLGAFNAAKPRILVLHSSDETSSWVKNVDVGIRQALAANRRPVTVQWHSMRLDRTARGPLQDRAAVEARRAIAQQDPDVLIAVDDESNEAVARYYVGRTRPRVLFVSIDQPPERYGYDGAANVSGIVEELPLAAVCDALLAMRDGRPARIAAIGVDNDTGAAERAQVERFDWSPHELTAATTVGDFVAWKQFVVSAAEASDVVIVLSYMGLARGAGDQEPVASGAVASWMEEQVRPQPIGLHVSYVVDGGGIAFSPSPADYGQRAMAAALAWLEQRIGTPPPPIVTSAHFDVALRPRRLAARGVALPPIYVEAARAGGMLFDE